MHIQPTMQISRIKTARSNKSGKRMPLAEINRMAEIEVQNLALLKKI
jgi:hypothetical protein